MGTSTSCAGGMAGSPFDPEWLSPSSINGVTPENDSIADDAEAGTADSEGKDDSLQEQGSQKGADEPAFAPSRRYANARSSMSSYLGGGGREPLRAALKNMVRQGMGGAKRAASTMRGSAHGAASIGQFLLAARDNTDTRVQDWVQRTKLLNLSAADLILELVKEVMPATGSVDEESCRNSLVDALSQLYEESPDLDLFFLTDEQIYRVMSITVANEVCSRIDLQLGQTYEKLKYGAAQIQLYRNDVREYVCSLTHVLMNRCRNSTPDLQKLATEVLQSTLEVFAE